MATQVGDILSQIGAGVYRLIKGKDVNISEADDHTTLGDTDVFLVDAGNAGTQASTKKITASDMQTYFGNPDGTASHTHVQADVIDLTTDLAGKVDTVVGMGLSENSYSDSDVSKLSGIEASANNYTHLTTNGNKHIPASGSAGQFLGYSSAGTAQWVAAPTGGSGDGISLTVDSGGSTYSDVGGISFVGNNISVHSDAAGSVVVSSPPVTYSSSFSINSDPVSNLTTYRVAIPHASTSKYFHGGDWSGTNARRVTDSNLSFSTSSTKGNMENNSKIKVTVFGPEDNTSSGSGNTIGTHSHTVTSNGTSTGSGITITVSSFDIDGVSTKNKAIISVTFNPSVIPSSIGNFSGSQKYHSINITVKTNMCHIL